jgi:hypothetical protein
MTTITRKSVRQVRQPAATYGNVFAQRYNFTTTASGVFANSDLTTAVQSADVVRLGIIPAGTELLDVTNIISDAFTASTTASIGFAYTDGVDSTDVPQSATFFNSALATDSTSVSRKTAVTAPVTLPKDAYLILTIGGAAHASAGILDIILHGIWHGTP